MKRRAWMLRPAAWVLLAVLFLGGGAPGALAGEDDTYRHLKTFAAVLDLVERNYVEEVDPQKAIYGAINGMLAALDPYSSFLTPEEYGEMNVETEGRFTGIGIEISIRDGVLTVVAPIEGTPADRAGIRSNDRILKIDGVSTKNMTMFEAVKRLRGPKGSKVTLSIYREGWQQLQDVEIVRDVIPIRSVRWGRLEDGYGYVRISTFQHKHTTADVRKALRALEGKAGLRGLVLDLRNNPGGLLDQAIGVADLFLDEGLIVYTDGRLKEQQKKYYARKNGHPRTYPVVVLVNGGSASASEIVTGALQDHHRALVLGTKTFGKASVQTIIPLEDGAALRLTTAHYFTPAGRSIHEKGIVPDLVVPYVEAAPEAEEAGQGLYERLGVAERQKPEAAKAESGGSQVPMDNQIEEALRILKAWDVFSRAAAAGEVRG
ncbi:S41 family peptidase [Dissulfurirhabdus thermomarina]|nr:S41 family peptidase [Dissulfurirhabdus thermomarina]